MSFPFLQPYAGLSNSLQTAQGGAGAGVGGWVEVARTTVGTTGDSMDVTSIPDKRYYMVLLDHQASGSSQPDARFNSDSGSNYSFRFENDGSAGTGVNKTNMKVSFGWNTSDYGVWYISNLATKEKLSYYQCATDRGSGAGTAPSRSMTANKWTNTSSVINAINFNQGSTGDFAAGSECVVLGYDPDDTHTTNFWEELASVNGDGSSSTLSSGTFTAKKYLWIQAFVDAPTSVNMEINLGNGSVDTGGNYSYRSSGNGAADATATSAGKIALDAGAPTVPSFMNLFIINVASREKYVIAHQVDGNTAGAGTAPDRRETVGKWANTSNQANIIDFKNTTATNLTSSSILKVWGAD